ncbi:MAG: 4Fe-4S dicluster domain-containing protein [Proteobacteria bacterium]|nr:4Fe-4S dicluster domain-containing protein [Pseudomonadota bacterium]
MTHKDPHEKLIRFYEFMTGSLPKRGEFKTVLQDMVGPETLAVFFLIPFAGNIPYTKLVKKAGLPEAALNEHLDRLTGECLALRYETARGLSYERGNPVFMSEQQVRMGENKERQAFFARFFNTVLEGEVEINVPTKTPYYRVIPAEPTLKPAAGTRTVSVDETVVTESQVLPLDMASEMIRREARLIAVAECYCRKTKAVLDQGCDHPLETCFVFNELAESLIAAGLAREIDYDETVAILDQCEQAGLVHNIDNCATQLRSLCNCCACACIVLKMAARGYTNVGAPARFAVSFDQAACESCGQCLAVCPTDARSRSEAGDQGRTMVDVGKCIGCGLCVTTCTKNANRMTAKTGEYRLPRTHGKMMGRIGREAIVGKIKQKLLGRP